ncbi:hypothetical protein ILYODFUR_037872 [Ilyodon furcidens]|uniref:Uncharacterized protein n=1 Tax=Ilyodon furcidens TaxID=33524 RepID=A0ABV0VL58_9TELE
MSHRYRATRSDLKHRSSGASRWSHCRKRGIDGSLRTHSDEDVDDSRHSRQEYIRNSFTTPESAGPVSRCGRSPDWGSQVENEEMRQDVHRDMQRYRRRILGAEVNQRERKASSGSSGR